MPKFDFLSIRPWVRGPAFCRILVNNGTALYCLGLALAGYAMALFSRALLLDGDTYNHIATGNLILGTGQVPHIDPFSYSFIGKPWIVHEWLSEVLMALAYKIGGWNALHILTGCALALSLWMLARYVTRWLSQPAALILSIGTACIASSLLARPHILALPLMVMWMRGLLDAKTDGKSPSLWLLPLMTLWANMHGSFAFGLAMIGPIAVEVAIAADGNRWRVLRAWCAFGVAAVAAALVSPNFWQGLIFPLKLIRMKSLADIGEWQPTIFDGFQPIELCLIAFLYVVLTRGVKLPVIRVVLLIVLLHLALAHARYQMLAGTMGMLLLAEPFSRTFHDPRGDQKQRRRPDLFVGLLGGLVAIALTAGRLSHPVVRSDDRASPMTALKHVPTDLLNTPVFNSYPFGGYLVFNHLQPFIDGRADMFGDQFVVDYLKATTSDRAEFQKLADEYKMRWALLATDSSELAMVSSTPGWRVIYTDATATVLVRTTGPSGTSSPSPPKS